MLQNVLVCVSAEGYCHIFYFQEKVSKQKNCISFGVPCAVVCQKEFEDLVNDMKPTCTQRIPANIRVLLLDNISMLYIWLRTYLHAYYLLTSLVYVDRHIKNFAGRLFVALCCSICLTACLDASLFLCVSVL